jgi:hypothetical protein
MVTIPRAEVVDRVRTRRNGRGLCRGGCPVGARGKVAGTKLLSRCGSLEDIYVGIARICLAGDNVIRCLSGIFRFGKRLDCFVLLLFNFSFSLLSGFTFWLLLNFCILSLCKFRLWLLFNFFFWLLFGFFELVCGLLETGRSLFRVHVTGELFVELVGPGRR